MSIDLQDYLTANKLFSKLVSNDFIYQMKEPDLCDAFLNNASVRYLVEESAADSKSKVVFVDAENEKNAGLVLLPNLDNTSLGYTKIELEKAMYTNANVETGTFELLMFVLLVFIVEVYSGKDGEQVLDYLERSEFINKISEYLELGVNRETDEQKAIGINFQSLYDLYASSSISATGNTYGTKGWYVEKVVIFMRNQGLVNFRDDNKELIYPTERLTSHIKYELLDHGHFEAVKDFLKESGSVNE